MQRFKLRALAEWLTLEEGEILEFEFESSARSVGFVVNASDHVVVWGQEQGTEERKLLGAGTGLMEFEVSVQSALTVFVERKPKTVVTYRAKARDMTVEKMSFDKFTTIHTRKSNNPEFDRMLMLFRANEAERDRQLNIEMAALHRRMEEFGKVQENATPEQVAVADALLRREQTEAAQARVRGDASASVADGGPTDGVPDES